jgi:hypothetical protein
MSVPYKTWKILKYYLENVWEKWNCLLKLDAGKYDKKGAQHTGCLYIPTMTAEYPLSFKQTWGFQLVSPVLENSPLESWETAIWCSSVLQMCNWETLGLNLDRDTGYLMASCSFTS